jgi:hypothetical protein
MTANTWVTWENAFQGLPPVGHILRHGAADRWLRLYSLPDEDRLPSGPDAISEMLRRENLVASTVLGFGATVTAWVAHYGNAPPLVDMASWTWSRELPRWRCSASDLETLEGIRFLERTLSWNPGVLDMELKLRASDQLAGLTVFSKVLRSAFCPYDGGMDVFVRSPELAASLGRLFPTWISTHAAGL